MTNITDEQIEVSGLAVAELLNCQPNLSDGFRGCECATCTCRKIARAALAAAAQAGKSERDERQMVVFDWGRCAFGEAQMADKIVRAARMIEEAAELAQACDLPKDYAQRALDHIYSRPAGDPKQEAGGVGVTLMALCQTLGLSADECERVEVARCLSKPIEHFAARNQVKVSAVDQPHAPERVEPPMPAAEKEDWRLKVLHFANAILHGDDEHRAWLIDAADAFVKGSTVPKPRITAPMPAAPITEDDGTGDIIPSEWKPPNSPGRESPMPAAGKEVMQDVAREGCERQTLRETSNVTLPGPAPDTLGRAERRRALELWPAVEWVPSNTPSPSPPAQSGDGQCAEIVQMRSEHLKHLSALDELTMERNRVRFAARDYLLEQTDENAKALAEVIGWREHEQKPTKLIDDSYSAGLRSISKRELSHGDEIIAKIIEGAADRIATLTKALAYMAKCRDEAIRSAGIANIKLAEAGKVIEQLVAKIDAAHASAAYKSVWMINQLHTGPYIGPTYESELSAARAFVDRTRTV